MTTETVFRFVAVRPPRRRDPDRDDPAPRFDPRQRTRLHEAIMGIEPGPQARSRANGFAAEVLASDIYVGRLDLANDAFQEVAPIAELLRSASRANDADLLAAIDANLSAPVAEFTASERYARLRLRFWDSFYAHVLLPAASPGDLEGIVTGIRVLDLLARIVARPTGIAAAWRAIDAAPPRLPPDLVPRPAPAPVAMLPTTPAEPAERRILARLDRLRHARNDVATAFRRAPVVSNLPVPVPSGTATPTDQPVASEPPPRRGLARLTGLVTSPERLATPVPGAARRPWMVLPSELSAETLAVLTGERIDLAVTTARDALAGLDRAVAATQHALLAMAPTLIGLPATPGGIRPTAGTGAPYRVLGFGDLEVVRQTLLRYEEGDIAHIENVMQTETRQRTHTWTRQTEERVVIEQERVDERERDLQTTERFELQREAERTIETDLSVQAGVSVTGKYGVVEVTATGDFAYSTSRSESERNASTFAREVTDRAVERVTARVREERLRRTVEEIKERNTHGFDNTGGPGHVRGIYHWVDKVYEAQIVNYGRRLMLEFVVPEPAAFYLFAGRDGSDTVDGATPPRPPVLPVLNEAGDAFVRDDDGNVVYRPLLPSDLEPDSYEEWVSAYGVSDATPPPVESVFIGGGIAKSRLDAEGEPEDPEWAAALDDTQLVVPAGWEAVSAWVQATSVQPADARSHNAFAFAGRLLDGFDANGEAVVPLRPVRDPLTPEAPVERGITGPLPLTYRANAPYFAINIEVHCVRTAASLDAWRLDTFGKVMTAYRGLQQAYDDARRRTERLVQIVGTNPARNRQVVRDELQKSCITLMTGERFDLFDAIQSDATTGYPEIELGEINAEGAAIRFLEQAFEWPQMTYLFYPYFWGRKEHWRTQSRVDDPDPAFGEFLRAGAARVVVPVRLGAELAVALYLGTSGGVRLDGGVVPVLDVDLFDSVADELRARQGVDVDQGPGTIEVVQGSRRVLGTGTQFDPDDDIDRELHVGGQVTRITEVRSTTEVVLATEFAGETADGVSYGLGPRLVGLPWEIRVPTSLVYLSDSTALPDWTSARRRR